MFHSLLRHLRLGSSQANTEEWTQELLCPLKQTHRVLPSIQRQSNELHHCWALISSIGRAVVSHLPRLYPRCSGQGSSPTWSPLLCVTPALSQSCFVSLLKLSYQWSHFKKKKKKKFHLCLASLADLTSFVHPSIVSCPETDTLPLLRSPWAALFIITTSGFRCLTDSTDSSCTEL